MKTKIAVIVCVLALALTVSGCGTSQQPVPEEPGNEAAAQEKDVRQEALSAYGEILKAAPAVEGEHEEFSDASFDYDRNIEMFGEHYDCFALHDIDSDGIPELIALTTVNFRWTPVSVYTYKDGQAILLRDPSDQNAHGTFEQASAANGAYITYFCDKNHIHSVWRGTDPAGEKAEENKAYVLKGTSLCEEECVIPENEKTVYFTDIAKANTAENAEAELG